MTAMPHGPRRQDHGHERSRAVGRRRPTPNRSSTGRPCAAARSSRCACSRRRASSRRSLDHNLDSFKDSGWIYPLFVAILFGYGLGGWQAGRIAPDGALTNGAARRRRRTGAVDPGAHRDLARARREPGPLHRAQPGTAAGADLRPAGDRRRPRDAGRLPRRAGRGTGTGPRDHVVTCPTAASRPGGRGPGRLRDGTGPRNVRTPQGTVLGNTQSGRPAGQCNREQTADGGRSSDRRTGKGETVR